MSLEDRALVVAGRLVEAWHRGGRSPTRSAEARMDRPLARGSETDWRCNRSRCTWLLVALCSASIDSDPAKAQRMCMVPGSHSTIQEAIVDGCTDIELQPQSYAESFSLSRSVTLRGPAGGTAVLRGVVEVTGADTVATLANLRVENGCVNALRVMNGARVSGSSLVTVRSAAFPCPPLGTVTVFADGFEAGDTSAWSMVVGSEEEERREASND